MDPNRNQNHKSSNKITSAPENTPTNVPNLRAKRVKWVTKISTNNAMPSGSVLPIELLLYMLSYILLYIVLLKCLNHKPSKSNMNKSKAETIPSTESNHNIEIEKIIIKIKIKREKKTRF